MPDGDSTTDSEYSLSIALSDMKASSLFLSLPQTHGEVQSQALTVAWKGSPSELDSLPEETELGVDMEVRGDETWILGWDLGFNPWKLSELSLMLLSIGMELTG